MTSGFWNSPVKFTSEYFLWCPPLFDQLFSSFLHTHVITHLLNQPLWEKPFKSWLFPSSHNTSTFPVGLWHPCWQPTQLFSHLFPFLKLTMKRNTHPRSSSNAAPSNSSLLTSPRNFSIACLFPAVSLGSFSSSKVLNATVGCFCFQLLPSQFSLIHLFYTQLSFGFLNLFPVFWGVFTSLPTLSSQRTMLYNAIPCFFQFCHKFGRICGLFFFFFLH